MTCNLRTVTSVFTDSHIPIRTVRTERTARTEFKPSKNIRAKQRNILSVDNDMQFTDRNLCLTDRQNLYGPYELHGPYELNSSLPRVLGQSSVIFQVSIMTCNSRTVNSVLRTVKNLYGPYEPDGPLTLSYGPSKPLRTVRTEFNPSKNIRAKQRNI